MSPLSRLGATLARLAACLALVALACEGGEPPRELLLATTTSVHDSGLLDALLPEFRAETGIAVRTVAVGTGAALRLGAEGNADALLTHAPEGESELLASGAAASRVPLFENYFVIAGPPADPADVAGAGSAAEAYARIVAAGAAYASRADDSGTHRREQALLRAAGLDAAGGHPRWLRTGAGMGLTLQVAGEKRAYTLSDRGTFLAFRERVGLAALSGAEPALRNVYSVLRVNPERFPGRLHADEALRLEAWLGTPAVRAHIAAFGLERFGEPLFRPLEPGVGEATSG